MQVQETTNYDMFTEITSNREVDVKHVQRLEQSIKDRNLLQLNPILVNKDHEVIDGQHRLQAARNLGVPIFYIISENVNERDMHRMNSISKNWQTIDYINYWTVNKAEGFAVISMMINKYPFVPLTSLMQLLSEDFKRDVRMLRDGIVDVSQVENAEKVIGYLREFRDVIGFQAAYTGSFITAIYEISRLEDYDHSQMIRKLQLQPRALVKCATKKQYKLLLEELYNYRNYDYNRVRFL